MKIILKPTLIATTQNKIKVSVQHGYSKDTKQRKTHTNFRVTSQAVLSL